MITPASPAVTPASEATTYRDKDGIPFEVRDYRPSDRVALERFYEAFEPKRAAQGLPPADPPRISRWLTLVLPTGFHLVAHRDAELIGHALVMPTEREAIGEYAVFLRADLRGRGVGTQLNHAVVERARARGLKGLWLTVEPNNRAAIRSYEKAGFRFVPGTQLTLEAEMELTLTPLK
jgi:RimJ/RimL family protein N-acetyltransferase